MANHHMHNGSPHVCTAFFNASVSLYFQMFVQLLKKITTPFTVSCGIQKNVNISKIFLIQISSELLGF